MDSDANRSPILRFSTRDLPERDRVPFWREVFGRQIVNVEIEPQSDYPLEAEATLLALPKLQAALFYTATPATWTRTAELMRDGNDGHAFLMPVKGALMRSQLGKDIGANVGDGVGILHTEPACLRFREAKYFALVMPRATLLPLVGNLEDATARLVPRGTEAVRLLCGYLAALFATPDFGDPELCNLVATHLCDLTAFAIGATRDGAEIAEARGVRAARLRAIKADILAHLRSPELSEIAVALRQGVTPRYVRMLFETEGTSFSGFVLEQRLLLAYRILANPLHGASKISSIAFAAGFGDLSYFNRCFRRRFGETPTQYRGGNGRVDKTE